MKENRQDIEEERPLIHGVVAFIIDDQGRILTVRETENKASTKKTIGEYGVICETSNQLEEPCETFRRGFEEELGVSIDGLKTIIDLQPVEVFKTTFVQGVVATVGVFICRDPDGLRKLIEIGSKSDGVEVVGWKTPDEFSVLNLRQGVRNIYNNSRQKIENAALNID